MIAGWQESVTRRFDDECFRQSDHEIPDALHDLAGLWAETVTMPFTGRPILAMPVPA
jgi:hypothetical protein